MKMSTGKAILSVFAAIVILCVAQLFSDLLLSVPRIPPVLSYALAGTVYTLIGFYLAKLFARFVLKREMRELLIPTLGFQPMWVVVSVLLPVCVTAVFLLLPGKWSRGAQADGASVVSSAVFYIGISAGAVEETLFRGIIMTVLRERWNAAVAVVAPSVVFALLHVFGRSLNLASFFMLLLAGTAVGIMFSLITLATRSVWNSALVHAVWNTVIIGGVLRVGTAPGETSILNYSVFSDNLFITGGDFGIEASIISVAAYLIVICLAAAVMHGRKPESGETF